MTAAEARAIQTPALPARSCVQTPSRAWARASGAAALAALMALAGCADPDAAKRESPGAAQEPTTTVLRAPPPSPRPAATPPLAAASAASAAARIADASAANPVATALPMAGIIAVSQTHHGHEEGGIGGTGIFGSVAGFARIGEAAYGLVDDPSDTPDVETFLVNGFRIGLTPEARERLNVGDVVALSMSRDGDHWRAESLQELHALVGPVTDIPAVSTPHIFKVMGVEVTIAGGAVLVDRLPNGETTPITDAFAFAPNDRLAVSGLWQSGAVVASRIERLHGPTADRASGFMTSLSDGLGAVGPLAIAGAPAAVGATFIEAEGVYRDGRLEANQIMVGMPPALARPAARLSVEGFLSAQRASDGAQVFQIDGLGMTLDRGAAPNAIAGGRAVVIGHAERSEAGVMHAQHGVPLPDDRAGRASILQELGADAFRPVQHAAELR